MKKLLLATVAAAGMALASVGAQAAVVGSTPGPAASNPNNVIGAVEGWFGANLYLIAGANTMLDVYFLGREAGFTNSFTINGNTLVTSGPPPASTGLSTWFGGTTAPTLVGSSLTAPGLISFVFDVLSTGGSVTNGSNLLPPPGPGTGTPNFFVSLTSTEIAGVPQFDTNVNGVTPGSGTWALLALDDGGAGPDDNHDDLVVVLHISNGSFGIPEPATLGLLGAGLVGLGMAARRRRKA